MDRITSRIQGRELNTKEGSQSLISHLILSIDNSIFIIIIMKTLKYHESFSFPTYSIPNVRDPSLEKTFFFKKI